MVEDIVTKMLSSSINEIIIIKGLQLSCKIPLLFNIFYYENKIKKREKKRMSCDIQGYTYRQYLVTSAIQLHEVSFK